MATLKSNGTEIARFRKRFPQPHRNGILEIEHAVMLKTFATKPTEIRIMRKRRWVAGAQNTGSPGAGQIEVGPWTPWKLQATARSRNGALRWHDARGWAQVSGGLEREAPTQVLTPAAGWEPDPEKG